MCEMPQAWSLENCAACLGPGELDSLMHPGLFYCRPCGWTETQWALAIVEKSVAKRLRRNVQ